MIPVNIHMGAKQNTIGIPLEPGQDIFSVDGCFGHPLKTIKMGIGTPAKQQQ
jgi:hypothetical protein